MRIYTRTGDTGLTKIFGNRACEKDDIRIECNGKLDEANSFIGLLRSKLDQKHEWQNIPGFHILVISHIHKFHGTN